MNESEVIIIGKNESRMKTRLTVLLLYLFFLYWGFILGWYSGILCEQRFIITEGLAASLNGYHLVTIPLSILIITLLFINIIVKNKPSWSVSQYSFTYNDDTKMPFFKKCQAFKQILQKGYYLGNVHCYQYEEICYIKLYYRKRLGLGGALAYPMYFKIYLEDGSILDAPCRVDPDGTKVYHGLLRLKAMGIPLEDENGLMDYLKNNRIFDEKDLQK